MKSPLWSVVLAAVDSTRLVETVARLAPVCPAKRTVVVASEAQRAYVNQWPSRRPNRVVFQPEDRGTAAGVLLGLVSVLTTDPNAVALISPSDYEVADPDAFRREIRDAAARVRRHDDVMRVRAKETTLIVARARTLLDLCRERLPDLAAVFVGALTLPSETRERFLKARYAHLEAADFFEAVLRPAADHRARARPPDGVVAAG